MEFSARTRLAHAGHCPAPRLWASKGHNKTSQRWECDRCVCLSEVKPDDLPAFAIAAGASCQVMLLPWLILSFLSTYPCPYVSRKRTCMTIVFLCTRGPACGPWSPFAG